MEGVELFEKFARRVKPASRFKQGLGQLLDDMVVTACRNALNVVGLVVKGLEDKNQRSLREGKIHQLGEITRRLPASDRWFADGCEEGGVLSI